MFASRDATKGGLFKVSGKIVRGREKNPEQFANTPEHCFFVNDDVSTMPIPEELDKGYYSRMIYDRLEDFGVTFDLLDGGGDFEPCSCLGATF